ncbi:MAG: ribosome-associated translation inhibitor RaiA [Candidatus Paceibacterota bacterium]|jgi:putative sigma-54 modulation protein
MKHNVKVTDFSLTPAISDYLESRVNHLDKFISPENKDATMCYVEIGKTTNHHKKGDLFEAEFTVHIGGKSFRAIAKEEDLYTALDIVTEEMTEELRSFKDKNVSAVKRGGAKLKSLIKSFYDRTGR